MDETVSSLLAAGYSLEEVITVLCDEKHELENKIAELEAIRPRKFLYRDGTILTWYPPEELIPSEPK